MTSDPVIVSAAEQMPFILVVCEGPELRLRWFNAATRALLPGRVDPLGRPLGEVFTELGGQQWMAVYYEVYRTGEPVTGAQWRAHLTRPDGTIHEMWANFAIAPWRSPEGEILGVIGAGFDVTEMVSRRVVAERQAAELLDVVTALQNELLPAALPVLPGVQLAASYLLADSDRAAGGDWFDAISRPDGRVALIVGDVVGHGVTASAVMGQLRAVLQDRLDSGEGLAEAMAAADRFTRRVPAARATTVCLVQLDPADGTLTYCTAGHPAPLIVAAGGSTRFLPGTGGAPLGVGGSYPLGTESLAVGDLILLYSDGILERPGRTVPESLTELARVAAAALAGQALHAPEATPAERVATQTVELLVRAGGHNDDVTLLAAHRVTPPAELTLRLPGELTSLRVSRQAIGEWLAAVGATAEDTFVLQHALGELITNAIEHAYGGEFGRDEVEVRMSLTTQGHAYAQVTDHGRWREPARESLRGRGLALTTQLVESLTVQAGEHGTVTTLSHPLTRPARLFTGLESTGPTVTGVVDAITAARLQQDLLRRSRGGHLPLSVDLGGVTHLASAGVAALHVVAGKHREGNAELDLYAPAGSPAELVLTLVGLPHRTAPIS
jgi:serine phosphatase RsbU (regulator of sigma subunit)/anti-sigma regulatory factor (Ser/Thr protein kinase)